MTIVDDVDESPSGAIGGAKLQGRVAFVTGGTRGIGAAISKSLAAQGAVESERAKQNLSKLADALSTMHPGNAELARRVADLKEKLSTLTPEQLSPLAPQLSGAEFTAAVDRLANAGTQPVQQSAAQIMSVAGQGPLPGAEPGQDRRSTSPPAAVIPRASAESREPSDQACRSRRSRCLWAARARWGR